MTSSNGPNPIQTAKTAGVALPLNLAVKLHCSIKSDSLSKMVGNVLSKEKICSLGKSRSRPKIIKAYLGKTQPAPKFKLSLWFSNGLQSLALQGLFQMCTEG